MSQAGELFDLWQGFVSIAILGVIAFFGFAAYSFVVALLGRRRGTPPITPRPGREPIPAPVNDDGDDDDGGAEEWLKDFG